MATGIASFGIKQHPPQGQSWPWGARTCIDVRHFANPHGKLVNLTQKNVASYIEEHTPDFAREYAALRARVRVTDGIVCLYCTGGQHRSVYLANRIALDLGLPPAIHIDLEE